MHFYNLSNRSIVLFAAFVLFIETVLPVSGQGTAHYPIDSAAQPGISSRTWTYDPLLSTLIGPGDALRITVTPDTSSFLTGTYVVLDSGTIALPIIGFTKVTSMTLRQFSVFLTETYTRYLRYPNLNIEPLIRVSLVGGFLRPGLYYVNPLHSVWSAVSLTGGPVREDGMGMLHWERDGKILSTDLLPAITNAQSLVSAGFRSGDVITVTARPKYTGMEIFTRDILPVFSFVVSSVTATATVYLAYEALHRGTP